MQSMILMSTPSSITEYNRILKDEGILHIPKYYMPPVTYCAEIKYILIPARFVLVAEWVPSEGPPGVQFMLSKNRSLRHKLLSGAGLLTILLGAAAVEPANATPSVSFAVSEIPGIGSLTVQGSSATGAGSFTIATPHFGGTASFLGSPLLIQPTFDTNTLSVSTTTGGTLYVYLTEQGLTAPLGIANFLSSFTANTFTGGAVNVIEKTFVSTTNALWTGTALGTQTFTSIGSTAMLNGTPSLSAPYSETAEFIINIVGAGSENDTINIADPAPAVPEPMSMAILGTALCSLGIIRRRKVARA